MPDNIKVISEVLSEYRGSFNDQKVYLITLINNGVTVKITNLGSAITAIHTADRNGLQKNIVAGFEDPMAYMDNPHYFGCVLGRYAGRIADAKFILDDNVIKVSQNQDPNHLHGGFEGFNKKIWKINSFISTDERVGVIMEYLSEDGEEGYPGNLWVKIKYILNRENQLSIEYQASTDKSTPVNLSNHSYFNLTGFETSQVLNHQLRINAHYYTEKNKKNVPTGNILPVTGLPFDFLELKEIGKDIHLTGGEGFDHNFVLPAHAPGEMVHAVNVKEPETGRMLNVYTDQPAVHLYTANLWDASIIGWQGYYYQQYGGIALETQNFPDAPNQPGFPNSILHPGETYLSTTIYEFAVQ